MSATDYTGFQHDVLADTERGPVHGEIVNDVASNLTSIDQLIRLTANEPEQLNDTIDAQLDRLIAASNGDQRLALYAVTVAFGMAMRMTFGPRGGH